MRQWESHMFMIFGVSQIILGCTEDYRNSGCSVTIYVSHVETAVPFLVLNL